MVPGLIEERSIFQSPVERKDPPVVGAGQKPAANVAGFSRQGRAAVRAHVVEDANLITLVPNNKKSVSRDINRKDVAGFGHTLSAGDADPFTRKDPSGFILKDIFVTKDMTRQRTLPLQEIPNILQAGSRGARRI
jgi:hypothetical protein